ncbi:MAG: cytoplasmic protein [Deltaproteobacteria bacterium]|nr:MAG: cytoplasmic protein [Deltaproteobacteria bacterium]
MSEHAQPKDIDFAVDRNNLYREESFTDLKVASIRRLIPVNQDGTEDRSRTPIFLGHTQLMSPEGPVPLQARLMANNLDEAMNEFPKAMESALAQVVENLKELQKKEAAEKGDSRIIVP